MLNVFFFVVDILQFNCVRKRASQEEHPPPTIPHEEQLDWYLDESSLMRPEALVGCFTWSQWDCENQSLFYIHMKPKAKSLSLNDTEIDPSNKSTASGSKSDDQGRGQPSNKEQTMIPTLSALQFHNDLPTETVVSINWRE